ncbi:DUF4440 domain-containing protein [Nocardia sp. NPDC059195]|uniref:nuclear transport factor 2 family protein n=1 Tax=Nocardia sp. NPDC059195 TaxID=3346765 RepID=UPI00369167D9
MSEPVDAVIARELRLLDQKVRSSPELISELLDPDFCEIGASGRRWSRSDIIAAVVEQAAMSDIPIQAYDMHGELLADDVVFLTYTSESDGRRAYRSSLWRRVHQGWQLYFHQGTLSSS